MATVFVSAFLRPAIGVDRLVVPGATVGEIISRLDALHPGVAELLVEDDDIKPGIAVAINDQVGQMGLFDNVDDEAEIHFLPALSGGAGQPELPVMAGRLAYHSPASGLKPRSHRLDVMHRSPR